jgi:branched-chain amino acid transport system permease protein
MSLSAPATGEAPPFNASKALRDALIATVIGLGVFGIVVGFQTGRPVDGKPFLETRPLLLGVILAAIFIGSLLRSWFAARKEAATYSKAPAKPKGVSVLARIEPIALPIILGLMAIYPLFILGFASTSALKWIDSYGIQILIYIMLGWGLNIVVGLAGLLDLGYVAFYAIGAYTYALLQTYYGVSFWLALPAAGVMAAFWGVMLGFPVLRLRGDYLAIVTFAFGEIIYLVAKNWKDFTGGGSGLSVQKIDFFGVPFNASPNGFAALFGITHTPNLRVVFLYYVIFIMALITLFVTIRLRKLPVGRAWEALREDEIACRSLGMNTTNTKLTAFAIGATFGGLAGCFFGARQGFVDPQSFLFIESAFILAIVVLGGMGSLLGVVLASIVLIAGIEGLREMDILKEWFNLIRPNTATCWWALAWL